MAILRNNAEVDYTITHNGVALESATHNGTVELWSAGYTVTYMVDTGVSYTEKVKKGETCLSPTTFTPTKSGWEFVGWCKGNSANGTVLTSLTANAEGITLYAIFKQAITILFDGNGATSGATENMIVYRRYNNGNKKNPSTIVMPENNYVNDGMTFLGWGTTASASVRYNPGSSITSSFISGINSGKTSITLYAIWGAPELVIFSATYDTTDRQNITYTIDTNDTNFMKLDTTIYSGHMWSKELAETSAIGYVNVMSDGGYFTRAVFEYDTLTWASYGYDVSLKVNGDELYDADYTTWKSRSMEMKLDRNAASEAGVDGYAYLIWEANVEAWDESYRKEGISAGCHFLLTKVTLYTE